MSEGGEIPKRFARNVAKNNGNRRSTTLADGNCRIGSLGPDFRGVHGLQYTNLGRNLTKPFEERLFNMVKPCTFHHARQTWTFEMNPARVIALASRNKNALSCKSTVEFHSASWYVCKYSRVTCIHVSAFGWKYGTKSKDQKLFLVIHGFLKPPLLRDSSIPSLRGIQLILLQPKEQGKIGGNLRAATIGVFLVGTKMFDEDHSFLEESCLPTSKNGSGRVQLLVVFSEHLLLDQYLGQCWSYCK